MTEAIVSIFVLGGSFFALAGAVGMLRFPCFFSRLHAASLVSTAGLGLLFIGEVLFFSLSEGVVSLKGLLVLAFVLVTTPVAAHALGRAAYKSGTGCRDTFVVDEYAARASTRMASERGASVEPSDEPVS